MKLMVGTGNGKARELASTTRLQASIGMGEGETMAPPSILWL